MSKKKMKNTTPENEPSYDLYGELVAHEIYQGLMVDLNEQQKAQVTAAVKQFTSLLQSGLLKTSRDMVESARNEVASDMVDDAIEKIRDKTGEEDG